MRVICILILFCLIEFAASSPNFTYSGTAFDYETGAFRYKEEYVESNSDDGLVIRIHFKDATRKIFVRKEINFTKHSFKPDFVQEDLRDGSCEAAITTGEITELKFRKNFGARYKTKKLKIPAPAVIDGGFNNFVKKHWQSLSDGRVVTFYFAVPSQLDYFKFSVQKVDEKAIGTKDAIVFRMEPDAFLLKALVPATILTYDKTTKRLIRYEGLSTINDRNGRSCHVTINYPEFGP